APRGRATWARVLLLAAAVAAIVAFYLAGWHRYFDWPTLRAQVVQFKAQVNEHLLLAVAVFAAIYIGVTALSLPVAAALSLLAGALFGRWLGTAVTVISATAGATLAFLGSRFLFRDLVERRFAGRLRVLQEGVERDGAYYLFTLRLVPLVP